MVHSLTVNLLDFFQSLKDIYNTEYFCPPISFLPVCLSGGYKKIVYGITHGKTICVPMTFIVPEDHNLVMIISRY
jgi:hypothetical protein